MLIPSCLTLLSFLFFNHPCHCLCLCQPLCFCLCVCVILFFYLSCVSPSFHLSCSTTCYLLANILLSLLFPLLSFLFFSYFSEFSFGFAQTFNCCLFTHPLRFIPTVGLFLPFLPVCCVGFQLRPLLNLSSCTESYLNYSWIITWFFKVP